MSDEKENLQKEKEEQQQQQEEKEEKEENQIKSMILKPFTDNTIKMSTLNLL